MTITFKVDEQVIIEAGQVCSIDPDGKGGGRLWVKGYAVSGVTGGEEGQASGSSQEASGLLDQVKDLFKNIPVIGDLLSGGVLDQLLGLLGGIGTSNLNAEQKAKLSQAMQKITAIKAAAQVAATAKAPEAQPAEGEE